jgi:NADPH-dependent 2,4-dienoyl-CoA reductase/sulfur reductase-like enzyme
MEEVMKAVIIGGIAAGTSAAAKAKRVHPEMELTLYERGSIVSFGACGLPYYAGNMFDDPERMISRTPEQLQKSGIEVKINHEVLKVNRETKKVTVKNHETDEIFEDSFDVLMIASGSYPIIPPFNKGNLQNIFTFKTLSDGESLRKLTDNEAITDIAIIGAGFIGIELADMMRHKGKKVRLIQLAEHVMPDVLDTEFSVFIEEELKTKGILLHLNEAVSGFEESVVAGNGGKVGKVLTDKGSYAADAVIICVGVRPNTAFLEDSGIEREKNGAIMVNQYGQTNIPFIFAAGDCAVIPHRVKEKQVYLPLAGGANKLGRIAGINMANYGKPMQNWYTFEGILGSAAIAAIDLEVGRTGLSEKEAKNIGLHYGTVLIHDKNQTDYCGEQFDIHVKLIYDKITKVILGGQVAGYKGAVLRTDIIAAAVFAKLTTDQLGFMDLCYAPPFSRTWDCVNTAANAAK